MYVQHMSVYVPIYSRRSKKDTGYALGFWFLVRLVVESCGYRGMQSCQTFYVGDGIQTQVFMALPTEPSPRFSSSGF